MNEQLTVVDEADVEALDRDYRPFPAFDAWPQAVPNADLWEAEHGKLDAEKRGVDPRTLDDALEFVMRAAALDSGAIEGLYTVDRGFTITVASQAAAWQSAVEDRGADVRAHFEAQLKAYELVLDAATKHIPITEVWLRRLHEEVCSAQATYEVLTPIGMQEQQLPKGTYKQSPNHVRLVDGSSHSYAPVDVTGAEMHRLVDELANPAFAHAHPVLQASYAHYALVAIHPFADGNGRVARSAASTYSYRATSVPLLIFADRRFPYFDALRAADLGDPDPFVRFVFEASLGAMRLVVDILRSAKSPRAVDAVQILRNVHIAQGGLTHQELDRVAQRVLETLAAELARAQSEIEYPPGIRPTFSMSGPQALEDHGSFRSPIEGGNRVIDVGFLSAAPADASVGSRFGVRVTKGTDEFETVQLVRDTHDLTTFSLADVHPDLSAAAEQRIRALADGTCGSMLDGLSHAAEVALRRSGYGTPDE